jgi:hypothetical protein
MTPQRQDKAGDLIRLSISVPPPVHAWIKAEGEQTDRSFSSVCVEILEDAYENHRAMQQAGAPASYIDAMARDPHMRARAAEPRGTGPTSPQPSVEGEREPSVTVQGAPVSEAADAPPSVEPIPPRPVPETHRGHHIRNLGYGMFCEDCKEMVR